MQETQIDVVKGVDAVAEGNSLTCDRRLNRQTLIIKPQPPIEMAIASSLLDSKAMGFVECKLGGTVRRLSIPPIHPTVDSGVDSEPV